MVLKEWSKRSIQGETPGQADLTRSGAPCKVSLSMGRVLNRVRELRIDRGWTQQQLADAVGVSRQRINSIECGRYVPSLELALAFAQVFARSTDSIFELEGRR